MSRDKAPAAIPLDRLVAQWIRQTAKAAKLADARIARLEDRVRELEIGAPRLRAWMEQIKTRKLRK